MNNLIHDLPLSTADGSVPILLDGSAAFSIQVEQAAGYRWTERYAIRKQYYTPLAIGSESTIRPGYYLVKEQNFRDIGGGFFEWDRLYANIPQSWNDTRQFAFNYTAERQVITTSGGETTIETFQTSRSAQVSTRVNHTYQLGYPATVAQSLSDPIYGAGAAIAAGTTVRPNEVEVYLGNIYVIKTYTLITPFSA